MIHIRKPASGGGEALEDTAREALMEVARGLALAVPNVTRLYMGSYQMEKMSRTLSGLLIDSFVKRLRIVDCMSPVVLTVPEFSGQLTQLNIALDSSAEKLLPRICARTLQNLRLYHVPRSFSWEAFQDRLTPGHIHFACLRDVSLYFTELQGGHDDHHLSSGYAGLPSGEGCRLHFPQVRRLKIDCCPPYCEALYASQLPSSMETLSYSGTLGTMDALTSLKLQRIADVALSVYSTGEDDMDGFYHATNHIYGDVEITRESVLELTQSTITLDPQRVAWPNLSQLYIHGLYEFDLLVGLLGRLPMLRRLDMHGLAMNNLQTGTFIPALEGAELSPLPLVGPRLQKLTLYEDTRSTYSDLAALAIQSLVLRLRSLRRLNLSGRLQIDKDAFVPRYSSRFSHLERLTIKSYVMV
ncbi:hypothetical protein GGF46_004269 [Coemansia sp. RSA 552]|nr:hypothetical protein GGF46_004269 [Coemansia sp. RSA 552]